MTYRVCLEKVLRLAGIVVLFAGAGIGCSAWFADPATRLADDIIDNVRALQKSGQTERTFVHEPVFAPDGCSRTYRVTVFGGAEAVELGIGCDDAPADQFAFTTNRIARAVSVPLRLSVVRRRGDALTVTLHKRDGMVALVRIE